jgi:hypothetical protein
MPPSSRRAHDQGMSSNFDHDVEERARVHDAANRDRFAIRRTLRAMAIELKRLEREAHDFDVRQQRTKDAIEETWLVEHWGRPPLKPPAWRTAGEER